MIVLFMQTHPIDSTIMVLVILLIQATFPKDDNARLSYETNYILQWNPSAQVIIPKLLCILKSIFDSCHIKKYLINFSSPPKFYSKDVSNNSIINLIKSGIPQKH